MKKERLNLRRRMKETLALAMSVLMVLGVILVPVKTQAKTYDGTDSLEGKTLFAGDVIEFTTYPGAIDVRPITFASDSTFAFMITPEEGGEWHSGDYYRAEFTLPPATAEVYDNDYATGYREKYIKGYEAIYRNISVYYDKNGENEDIEKVGASAYFGFRVRYHDKYGNVLNGSEDYCYMIPDGTGEAYMNVEAASLTGYGYGWSTDSADTESASVTMSGLFVKTGDAVSFDTFGEYSKSNGGTVDLYPVYDTVDADPEIIMDDYIVENGTAPESAKAQVIPATGDDRTFTVTYIADADMPRNSDNLPSIEPGDAVTESSDLPTVPGEYFVRVKADATEPQYADDGSVTKKGLKAVDFYMFTFEVDKYADAEITPVANLVYNKEEQALVTVNAEEGTVVEFQDDEGLWSEEIPVGTDAGEYELNYKIYSEEDAYTVAKTGTVKAEIKGKQLGITWGSTSFTYNKEEQCPTATVSGLIGEDSADITISGAETDAGTYTATAEVDMDEDLLGNYILPSDDDSNKSFTISPKTVGLTWGTSEFAYDGENHVPTATATDLITGDTGVEVTVTGEASAIGTHTATASAISDDNYQLPTNKTKTFTIIGNPEYTLPEANDRTYDGSTGALVKDGEAQNGHFEYSTTETGTYSQTVPTAKNAGTYSVWVKVVGDEYYNDLGPFEIEVTISPKTVGLTWGTSAFAYDGESHAPTATATGLVTGDTGVEVTVTGAASTVGTHTATASAISDDNYQLPANKTKTYTIIGDPEYTSPVANNRTYDGTTSALVTGGTVSGGHFEYSTTETGTYSETVPTAKNADSYSVWVKVVGDEYYNDVDPFEIEVTISPKTIGLTWTDTEFVYDGEEHVPTATATGLAASDTCTVTVTGAKTAVGTYTATASALSNDNYELPANKTTSFTILAADPVYTLPSANNRTYDGTTAALVTGGEADGGHFEYSTTETGTYTETVPTEKNAGTYSVFVKVVGDDNHNDTTPEEINVTISPKTIGLTWTDTTFVYDGEEHVPTASATGLASGDTCTVTVTGAQTAAGTYTATASALSNDNYELPAEKTTSFTISSADPVYTLPSANDRTYDGTTAALVTGGRVDGGHFEYSTTETGTYSETVPTEKNAGTYTVFVKVVGDDNHNDTTPEEINITISPKTIGLTWTDTTFVYDGEEHVPAATATGLASGDTCIVTVTGAQTAAGTYTATASTLSNDNYELPANKTTSFTISSADPVYTLPFANNRTYDGTAAVLVTGGEVNGGHFEYSTTETGTYSETVPTEKNAGTYSVFVKVVGDDNHNDTTPEEINTTISPKTIGLTWTDTELVYNAEEQLPTATAENVETGDSLTVTVRGAAVNVGTYTATAFGITGTGSANYVLPATVTASFEIIKADAAWANEPAAVSDLKFDKTYHALVTAGTTDDGTVSYALQRAGADLSWSDEIPTAASAGTYTVWYRITGDANHNDVEAKSVNVTIEKGEGVVDGITPATGLTYDGEEHMLFDAYSAPGEFAPDPFNLVYSMDGGETFDENIPKGTNAGTYQVVVKRLETANTRESAPVTYEVTIAPKKVELSWSDTAFTYNGLMHVPSAVATGLIGTDAVVVTVSGAQSEAGTYTATATEISGSNYALPEANTTTFTIAKIAATVTKIPVAKTLTENGTEQALIEAGAANGGSMYYSLSDTGVYSTAVPTAKSAGTYKVWYKAVGDANHTDTESAYVSVTVKNKPEEPVKEKANGSVSVSMGSFIFGGESTSPVVSSSTHDASGAIISYKPAGADDSAYTSNMPTAVGSYTVRAVVSENDNYKGASATAGFTISYLPIPEGAYAISGKKGDGGWYTSGVTLTPAAGYEISLGNRAQFTEQPLTLSEEDTGRPFYIRKKDTGEQTAGITVAELHIDADNPEIHDMEAGKIYYADDEGELKAFASDRNISKIYVNGYEVSFVDNGTGEVIFDLPTDKKKQDISIRVVDKAGNETTINLISAPAWLRTGIIRVGELYLETGTAYKTPQGSATWTNDKESTVYMPGITFYSTEEGDFTFSSH